MKKNKPASPETCTSGDSQYLHQHPSVDSLSRREDLRAKTARKARFLTATTLLAMSLPSMVHAEESIAAAAVPGTGLHHFDIAPQPLYLALGMLAEQGDVQFVYTAEMVKGLTSPGVKGQFTAEEALTRILKGSGLGYHVSSPNTITLERNEPISSGSSAGDVIALDKMTVSATSEYNPAYPYDESETLVPSFKKEFELKEPQTVHTISREDLDTVKFTDPYQVLNRVPGVTSLRNLRFPIGGRGYTVNLMDGISVRDPLRGQVSDIANFDTDEIQRIEVTKGPASAIFPSNAFGGVINVITKEPPDEPVRRLWFEGGANDTNDRFRGGGHAAGKLTELGDLGYRLSFNIWDVPSWRENTWTKREVGSGKITYRPDDISKVTFRGEYFHREDALGNVLTEQQFKENPQQATGYSSYGDLQTLTFSMDYEREVNRNGFFKASYGVRNQYGFNFASFSGPADDDYLDMDSKIMYRHHFDFLDTFLTGGIEIFYGNQETINYNENPGNSLRRGNRVIGHFDIDQLAVSPFIQAEVSPLPWMHLTAGVRYDDVSYEALNKLTRETSHSNFRHFSPKTGITLDLSDEHKLWFNYSFGFAAPAVSFLFTNELADPNLKPELAENLEVGVRGSLINRMLDYEVAYYNTDVTDFLASEIAGNRNGRDILRAVNAGKVNLQGLETSLRFLPVEFLRFEVAHAYALNKYINFIDGRNDFSGNYVPVSPEHVINARAAVMPIDKLSIELEIQAQTEYYTNNNNALDPSGTYQRPTLLNLRASYEYGPAEFWLHFINLTDTRAARVSSAQRGRNVVRSYTSVEEPLSAYAGIAFKF